MFRGILAQFLVEGFISGFILLLACIRIFFGFGCLVTFIPLKPLGRECFFLIFPGFAACSSYATCSPNDLRQTCAATTQAALPDADIDLVLERQEPFQNQ